MHNFARFQILSCTYDVLFRTISLRGGGSCIPSLAPNSLPVMRQLSCPGPHHPLPVLTHNKHMHSELGRCFCMGRHSDPQDHVHRHVLKALRHFPEVQDTLQQGAEKTGKVACQNGCSRRVAYSFTTALSLLIAISGGAAAAHTFSTLLDRSRPYGFTSTAVHSQSLLCPTE